MRRVLFYLFVIPLVSGDISVSVNLKGSNSNEISNKFISSEIDFHRLMQSEKNFSVLTPSYLKIKNFFSFLHKTERHAETLAVFQSLYRNKITPVIVLDYNISTFEPIALLEDFKLAKNLNIKECVWQLGESNSVKSTEIKKYADDLKTLKILCESVKRDRKLDWNVAAVIEFTDDKITFDVEGYDLGSFSPSELLSKTAMKSRDNGHKIWLTIINKSDEKKKGLCDESCLINGLTHANVLGESAKKGIDVVYLDSQDNFQLAINKMHNALIGTKTFSVRGPKSTQSSVFAYCAKKMNGGVTIMGVNYANTRAKVNVKLLAAAVESNSVISQYLLSIADGKVLLNNEKFNGTITPAYKFKKVTKKSADFVIPPLSIAFWVIKNANVKECKEIESNRVRKATVITSSTDDLLRQLAASRMKRQIQLPKFDFKFPSLMPSKLNHQRSISDVFSNANTEIYKVAPVELTNPLQSSENPALPDGDIYLLINDGMNNDYINADVQYPIERPRKSQKPFKKSHQKNYYDMAREASEQPEFIVSHDYLEAPVQKSTQKSIAKKSTTPATEIGELFEVELPPADDFSAFDQFSADSSNKNVEIKTVMRELEPTHRQSKKALLAAKRKFDQNQLMALLKDATLQEVDRAQIENADEYEVIDLSQTEDDYEEYDDDEDGFFGNDKYKVRTRRDVEYRRNEIPRYGDHTVSSSEEEDDDEDLIGDVHLYLPKHHEISTKKIELETLKPMSVNENSPVAVQVVNAFSKSLNDVIYTVKKNIIGWWFLFTSPQVYYS